MTLIHDVKRMFALSYEITKYRHVFHETGTLLRVESNESNVMNDESTRLIHHSLHFGTG